MKMDTTFWWRSLVFPLFFSHFASTELAVNAHGTCVTVCARTKCTYFMYYNRERCLPQREVVYALKTIEHRI